MLNIFNRKHPSTAKTAKVDPNPISETGLTPCFLRTQRVQTDLEILFDNLTFDTIADRVFWEEELIATPNFISVQVAGCTPIACLRYFLKHGPSKEAFSIVGGNMVTDKEVLHKCPRELSEAILQQIQRLRSIEEYQKEKENVQYLFEVLKPVIKNREK
jgi:hypothetical protein